MESASTSTTILDSYSLPHQQFSSLIAYNGNSNRKINSFTSKKSTRLPPISRYESSPLHQDISEAKLSTQSSIDSNEDLSTTVDPNVRVNQLEKSLIFVKQHSQSILKGLYNELEDLKRKNRDLQFQLIINSSLTQQTQYSSKEQLLIMPLFKECLQPQISQHITHLEKEVKRLRFALGETLKINSVLQNELQKLGNNRERNQQSFSQLNSNLLSSPPIKDFSKTLKQIYNSSKSGKQSAVNLPRITNSSK